MSKARPTVEYYTNVQRQKPIATSFSLPFDFAQQKRQGLIQFFVCVCKPRPPPPLNIPKMPHFLKLPRGRAPRPQNYRVVDL